MSDSGKPQGDDYLLKVDNPLVVPVDRKIRIVTTAEDVIHAWMVPAFGVKQDAIPGFVRDTWFRAEKVGDFYGQCTVLCGEEHAYMPIHVKVVSAPDYTAHPGLSTRAPGLAVRATPTLRWVFLRQQGFSPYVLAGVGPTVWNHDGGVDRVTGSRPPAP